MKKAVLLILLICAVTVTAQDWQQCHDQCMQDLPELQNCFEPNRMTECHQLLRECVERKCGPLPNPTLDSTITAPAHTAPVPPASLPTRPSQTGQANQQDPACYESCKLHQYYENCISPGIGNEQYCQENYLEPCIQNCPVINVMPPTHAAIQPIPAVTVPIPNNQDKYSIRNYELERCHQEAQQELIKCVDDGQDKYTCHEENRILMRNCAEKHLPTSTVGQAIRPPNMIPPGQEISAEKIQQINTCQKPCKGKYETCIKSGTDAMDCKLQAMSCFNLCTGETNSLPEDDCSKQCMTTLDQCLLNGKNMNECEHEMQPCFTACENNQENILTRETISSETKTNIAPKLLAFVLKLEEMRINLEKSQDKIEQIADYYQSKENNEKATTYEAAANALEQLIQQADDLKQEISNNLDKPETLIPNLKKEIESLHGGLRDVVQILVA
ncbi:hypothetical protein COV18_01120 [Candidatus Woesearchaeota archaeon CG10_big_fil_rev_8_21_14_0_10_37_12]|nr:MAG: hypothetical protein COV18_01120 [Candidatus Woesearchaeota archaeon CG10_big_fil_rev_8_21_14_0_10_37_12]